MKIIKRFSYILPQLLMTRLLLMAIMAEAISPVSSITARPLHF
ncbi:hypothetical protein QTN47_20350 [Danxiaibacter flavus]|uniref:Uncharacterized protein n=1 Tax=Danxiaibacter flavus TaxID=3049108 RepID=A0ABV3ZJX5_9BACT|nr:hypothetical protein QNM32_20355 [Chitinophagaceae bacterium DXS]